jgi:hypothetical protein
MSDITANIESATLPAAAGTEFTVFSADDALDALWTKAYQGEVLGEVLFERAADRVDDPDHASKLRVIAAMERRTKEAMVPAMERAGLPTEADPEAVSAGESLGDGLAGVPWLDFVQSFEPITMQYRAMYERIGELNPAEAQTAALLVAHELALCSFGRREAAGDSEHSLADILALPHMA